MPSAAAASHAPISTIVPRRCSPERPRSSGTSSRSACSGFRGRADLGAEVIKVELPGQGDFMRTIGPFVGDYSLFWAVEGRNKKSVTCDLRKPAGQVLVKRLVPLADVVVENFQPGTLESWGLGYDVLSALNPGLILTRVSVYGQTGPYRDRPGLDRNGIALGGLLYITGYPDRPPVRPRVVVADYLTCDSNAC